MKQFNGYDEAKKAAQFVPGKQLPKGAYVCQIIGVKFEQGKAASDGTMYSDRIIIQFDVVEGDYKRFFQTQYENNSNEDRKYKGRTSIYVPTDDGTKEDGWRKNDFARWTNALEESNAGYVWDWNESLWKGKLIGIVFGETGTVIEGKEIVFTEARFPVSVETVRSGKAPEAKFKSKNGYGAQNSTSGVSNNAPDAVEDIPI